MEFLGVLLGPTHEKRFDQQALVTDHESHSREKPVRAVQPHHVRRVTGVVVLDLALVERRPDHSGDLVARQPAHRAYRRPAIDRPKSRSWTSVSASAYTASRPETVRSQLNSCACTSAPCASSPRTRGWSSS